jgi:hypothetical protein
MSHNMALKPISRSAFAAPGQPSLADLISRVGASSDLSKTTRQNWCWALRTVARVAGKAPAAIPAHPEFLRRLMGKAAPGSMGLGIGAWNNAKSLTGKAMAWAALISIPRPLPGTLYARMEHALAAATAQVGAGGPAHPPVPLLQRQRPPAGGCERRGAAAVL